MDHNHTKHSRLKLYVIISLKTNRKIKSENASEKKEDIRREFNMH